MSDEHEATAPGEPETATTTSDAVTWSAPDDGAESEYVEGGTPESDPAAVERAEQDGAAADAPDPLDE